MRSFNTILVRLLLLLLAAHVILGGFTLLKLTNLHWEGLSYVLLGGCLLHAVLGICLTIEPLRQCLRTGKWYFRQNASFWIIRLSGLAILLLLSFHLTAFTVVVNGMLFLREFHWLRLLSQLLFVSAIFIHLVYAAKPLALKTGVWDFRESASRYVLIYTIFALFSIFALISYFCFWNF